MIEESADLPADEDQTPFTPDVAAIDAAGIETLDAPRSIRAVEDVYREIAGR